MTEPLPTNEQLSAEIARRLFGWHEEPDFETKELRWWFSADGHEIFAPIFADDHNAALGLVVPAMWKRGYGFNLDLYLNGVSGANFYDQQGRGHWTKADNGSLPRAICLAAVAALDAERHKDDH